MGASDTIAFNPSPPSNPSTHQPINPPSTHQPINPYPTPSKTEDLASDPALQDPPEGEEPEYDSEDEVEQEQEGAEPKARLTKGGC